MLKILLAIVTTTLVSTTVSAAQLILTPSAVIGSSGWYGFPSSTFQASNIFDQQTGTVTEPGQVGYWINPDNGPAAAYITIDLGVITSLSSLAMYNTHNGQYADRGTGNFTIFGSNSVSDSGGGNFVLVGASTVLNGTLNPETNGNPAAQIFAVSGLFRYLSFNPTSVSVGGAPCCGTNVYGLDELRVTTTVPEPATWGLMIAGFAVTGVALRRRKAAFAA